MFIYDHPYPLVANCMMGCKIRRPYRQLHWESLHHCSRYLGIRALQSDVDRNKNAFQHCVTLKPFVTQANFKIFAWITGKKLKSQVNQSS